MSENKPTLREQIAEAFRIARKEGALTRFADGKSDAEDVCWWFKEELEGLPLTYEEIDAKLENDWDGLDQISLAQFVQEYTIKELKEKMG